MKIGFSAVITPPSLIPAEPVTTVLISVVVKSATATGVLPTCIKILAEEQTIGLTEVLQIVYVVDAVPVKEELGTKV